MKPNPSRFIRYLVLKDEVWYTCGPPEKIEDYSYWLHISRVNPLKLIGQVSCSYIKKSLNPKAWFLGLLDNKNTELKWVQFFLGLNLHWLFRWVKKILKVLFNGWSLRLMDGIELAVLDKSILNQIEKTGMLDVILSSRSTLAVVTIFTVSYLLCGLNKF